MGGTDLRGQQLRDAYQQLITMSSTGQLGGGQAQNIPGIRRKNNVVVSSDDFERVFSNAPQVGWMIVSALRGNNSTAVIAYDSLGNIALLQNPSGDFEVGYGTPTGTTSTSGKIGIFSNNNREIHIESRLGASSENFAITIFGIEI